MDFQHVLHVYMLTFYAHVFMIAALINTGANPKHLAIPIPRYYPSSSMHTYHRTPAHRPPHSSAPPSSSPSSADQADKSD